MRKSKIAVCLMTALLLSVLALTELAQLRGETGGKRPCFCPRKMWYGWIMKPESPLS